MAWDKELGPAVANADGDGDVDDECVVERGDEVACI